MSKKNTSADANLFSRIDVDGFYDGADRRAPWKMISDIRSRINQDEMNLRRRNMIININLLVMMLFALVISSVALLVSHLPLVGE